ncbi:hypothetical protein TSMEX_001101 [Taenia solium]|eukprot:TsM_000342400 transcript=TsM_000342400 gene=TsM_000342400
MGLRYSNRADCAWEALITFFSDNCTASYGIETRRRPLHTVQSLKRSKNRHVLVKNFLVQYGSVQFIDWALHLMVNHSPMAMKMCPTIANGSCSEGADASGGTECADGGSRSSGGEVRSTLSVELTERAQANSAELEMLQTSCVGGSDDVKVIFDKCVERKAVRYFRAMDDSDVFGDPKSTCHRRRRRSRQLCR